MPSLSTLEDLWLKEKSTNVLKEEITIADCNQPDFPSSTPTRASFG